MGGEIDIKTHKGRQYFREEIRVFAHNRLEELRVFVGTFGLSIES